MALTPSSMSGQLRVEYVARAESILKAQEEIRASRAKMTEEERKAADEAARIAKAREAAFKVALSQMQEEERRARDIQKAIDDVSAAEAREAAEAGKAAGARKKAHSDWLGDLAKLGLAYDTLARIGGEAMAMIHESAERSRLEAAAYGVSLEKLQEASGGTRTEMELLTFASRTQHGAMQLSQFQMEMTQRAMRQLGREGYDLKSIQDGITESLTKGTSRSLKEFGIVIEESSDKAETHARILDALRAKADKLDDSYQTTSEGVQAGSASMTDALDKLKEAAGQLAIKLLPVVKAMADLATYAAVFVGKLSKDTGAGRLDRLSGGGDEWAGVMDRTHQLIANGLLPENVSAMDVKNAIMVGAGDAKQTLENLRQLNISWQAIAKIMDSHVGGSGNEAVHSMWAAGGEGDVALKTAGDYISNQVTGFTRGLAQRVAGLFDGDRQVRHKQEINDPDVITKLQRYISSRIDDAINAAVAAVAGVHMNMGDEAQFKRYTVPANDNRSALDKLKGAGAGFSLGPVDPELSADHYQEQSAFDAQAAADKAAALAAKSERKTKFLEGTFGKLSEFDAYKQAFGALTGAVGSAMGAWIDGSKSAGAAFKEFIGQALKGLAVQMEIEALKHAAYALGSLAFGDFSGAGRHAIAAAAFAAGGIAAGFAAKELGAGASSHSSAGGGGGSNGGSSSGGAGSYAPNNISQRPIVIVAGSDGSGETARQRQSRYQTIVDGALGKMVS